MCSIFHERARIPWSMLYGSTYHTGLWAQVVENYGQALNSIEPGKGKLFPVSLSLEENRSSTHISFFTLRTVHSIRRLAVNIQLICHVLSTSNLALKVPETLYSYFTPLGIINTAHTSYRNYYAKGGRMIFSGMPFKYLRPAKSRDRYGRYTTWY